MPGSAARATGGGGSAAPARRGRTFVGARPLLGRDDGLHGGDEAVRDLDVDHEGAELLDGLLEQHLALVDGEPARVLDGVGDVGAP